MPDLFPYRYRQLTIDLTSTLTDFEYPVQGERIYYEGPSDGPELTIRLQARNNDGIRLRPQGEIIGPFTRLYISGASSVLVPRLIVSSPKEIAVLGRDVNVGNINTLQTIVNPVTVSSITNPVTVASITAAVAAKDFRLDRAQAGALYQRGGFKAASVGNYSYHQIFNPAASGKTVVVLGVEVGCTSGTECQLMQYNTELGTDVGTLYNLLSGGSASSAHYRNTHDGSTIGTNGLNYFYLAANDVKFFDRFDVLGEGEGLLFAPGSSNIRTLFSALIWEF